MREPWLIATFILPRHSHAPHRKSPEDCCETPISLPLSHPHGEQAQCFLHLLSHTAADGALPCQDRHLCCHHVYHLRHHEQPHLLHTLHSPTWLHRKCCPIRTTPSSPLAMPHLPLPRHHSTSVTTIMVNTTTITINDIVLVISTTVTCSHPPQLRPLSPSGMSQQQDHMSSLSVPLTHPRPHHGKENGLPS